MQKTLRILLAEDDAEDAALFKRRCPASMQVTHVPDAQSALAELRLGLADICFTDYRLGADSGLDLIRAARAESLRVPIIVITGQDLESLGENALLAGATDFVAKEGLTTAEIQRASRWALIRRLAENRREDALGPDALSQLMGPAPPSAAAPALPANSSRPPRMELRRAGYISLAQRKFSNLETLGMCADFAAANARLQVTGVLVHMGMCFMQIIEGESQSLDILLGRIRRDSRHRNVAMIIDEPIVDRAFGRWSMGCFHHYDRHDLSASGLDSIRFRFERALSSQHATREDLRTLIGSLPELLARQDRLTKQQG